MLRETPSSSVGLSLSGASCQGRTPETVRAASRPPGSAPRTSGGAVHAAISRLLQLLPADCSRSRVTAAGYVGRLRLRVPPKIAAGTGAGRQPRRQPVPPLSDPAPRRPPTIWQRPQSGNARTEQTPENAIHIAQGFAINARNATDYWIRNSRNGVNTFSWMESIHQNAKLYFLILHVEQISIHKSTVSTFYAIVANVVHVVNMPFISDKGLKNC